jgi:hypothetical protein
VHEQNGLDSLFNIFREIIENNFPFPPEFGCPKASIFGSGVSRDAWMPFWLIA